LGSEKANKKMQGIVPLLGCLLHGYRIAFCFRAVKVHDFFQVVGYSCHLKKLISGPNTGSTVRLRILLMRLA
jgi:hypothetical protein